ncbi:MAG: hypothetical protein QOI69_2979 [Pseudonocardiales bacterium]|jgi:hypothetical protein|nr:hypothetical protein [Pseudonocardiales bacterium]
MIALVTVETVVLVILSVLVVGLLRGYATVLSRLHELDSGSGSAAPPFRTIPEVPEPVQQRIEGRAEWAPAHDIEGVSLTGEIISARTVGVEHDTVLAFLTSGCEGCAGFWQELEKDWAVPGGSRVLVVAKGPEDDSPEQLAGLCPPGVDLVMSSQAWTDFGVPGSPYVMVVDGRTGRVKGEGSGQSFSQVGGLIAQAVGDSRRRIVKPAADREREEDVDRALLAAGITPAHPSLYGTLPDGPSTSDAGAGRPR